MNLRCKPGDMAIVGGGALDEYQGMIITVGQGQGGTDINGFYHFIWQSVPPTYRNVDGVNRQIWFQDYFLTPIRPGDMAHEVEESKVAHV